MSGSNGSNGNGAHALQLPVPRTCSVCLEQLTLNGRPWCPACEAAWLGSIVLKKLAALGPDETARRNSITNAWAITRRKEVRRDREVARGCP